jgi:hypothetical protein
MAKKKSTKKKAVKGLRKKAVKKKAVKKKAEKKSTAKKSAKKAIKKSAKKSVKRTAAKKKASSASASPRKTAAQKATPQDSGPSLGRPKAKIDAKLDALFLRDFKAREVFDFLNVDTLRDLEQFSPAEIIDKLTAPMVQTVTRIRKSLAIRNRSLKGDKEFAADFKTATQAQVGRARPNR